MEKISLPMSIIPESNVENIVPIDDEAEKLAWDEQLMLDREDYYHLVSDY
jgi:hypothetical protein